MKTIELKRKVELPNADKTILNIGIHNITDEIFSHWYIQGLIMSGDIVVMDNGINKPIPLKYSDTPTNVIFPIDKTIEESQIVVPIEAIVNKTTEEVLEEPKKEVEVTEVIESKVPRRARRI